MHIGIQKQPYRSRSTSLTGIVLSLITGIVLLLLLAFFLLEPYSVGDLRFKHSYSVDIHWADDSPYVILCPVPTYTEGGLRKGFADGVVVTRGDATLSVEDSDNGFALKIIGRGQVNISWEDHWSGTKVKGLTNLSMTVKTGGSTTFDSWVYCDRTAIEFRLRSMSSGSLTSDGLPRGGSTTWTIDGMLSSDGWQLLPLERDYFGYI